MKRSKQSAKKKGHRISIQVRQKFELTASSLMIWCAAFSMQLLLVAQAVDIK